MAIPVILAETVAITELYILYTSNQKWTIAKLSKFAWITWGLYFIGVFFYLLFTVVVPLTSAWAWRWIADIIAVRILSPWDYSSSWYCTRWYMNHRMTYWRTTITETPCIFVGIFLVFAHIAMIFGMLDPSILWFEFEKSSEMNTDNPMMNMDHWNM
jgi:hypothetical protein